MKKRWAFMLVLLCCLFAASPALAAQEDASRALWEDVDELIGELDLGEMQQLFGEAAAQGDLGWRSLRDALQDVTENGLSDVSFSAVINALLAGVSAQLMGNRTLFVEIVLLLITSAFLKNLRTSFGRAEVSRAAFWAVYAALAALAAILLGGCVETARLAIEKLSAVLDAVTPVLVTLLTALGGVTASNLMSPALAALTGGVFAAVSKVVIPAIIVSAVLAAASNLSTTVRLKRFTALIQSGAKWFLGAALVVFLAVSTIKGLTGAALDGVSFKAAKYTVDKMVPFVGGMLSETLDTLLSCSLIVKNAVGVVGLVLLGTLLITPLCRLAAHYFLFRLAAALAEPFADEGSQELLTSMGDTVQLLFTAVLICMVMAFILITLFMGAADVSMMMR